MKNDELIRALREKPSRDNRELLDEAADAIEALEMQIDSLKARLDVSEEMRISLLSETHKKAIEARKAEREICLNCTRPTCDGRGSDGQFRRKNQRLPDAGSGKEEK